MLLHDCMTLCWNIELYVLILQESLCASESGCVKFSFLKHSEFLRVGARVILQEGVTRAIGEITQLEAIGEERTRCRKPSR